MALSDLSLHTNKQKTKQSEQLKIIHIFLAFLVTSVEGSFLQPKVNKSWIWPRLFLLVGLGCRICFITETKQSRIFLIPDQWHNCQTEKSLGPDEILCLKIDVMSIGFVFCFSYELLDSTVASLWLDRFSFSRWTFYWSILVVFVRVLDERIRPLCVETAA